MSTQAAINKLRQAISDAKAHPGGEAFGGLKRDLYCAAPEIRAFMEAVEIGLREWQWPDKGNIAAVRTTLDALAEKLVGAPSHPTGEETQ